MSTDPEQDFGDRILDGRTGDCLTAIGFAGFVVALIADAVLRAFRRQSRRWWR